MVVTIHQPDFLPWLGFFDRWKKSDLCIALDDVQFLRSGWHHRDKIKTPNGAAWLTVPICKKGRYDQLIKEARTDDSKRWRDEHLKTIEFNYKKAPNFTRCFSRLREIYGKRHPYLIDLNMELLYFVAEELGIKTPILFASRFNIKSDASERLVDLIKSVEGTDYLTGMGSKAYLDESLFERKGIRVIWHDYQHPVYNQLHGAFIPGLSAIDYLMMRDSAKN